METKGAPTPTLAITLLLVLAAVPAAAAAEGCASPEDEIATDRPDTTNSAPVVPQGSLQFENGIDWTHDRGFRSLAAPTTKARLGLVPCTEFLLDLPSYSGTVGGHGPSGFTALVPSVKHQFGELPGDVTVYAIVGLGLPTGAKSLSADRYAPLVQIPWTKELVQGWSLSGMSSAFFFPGDRRQNPTFEQTLELGWEVAPRANLFLEYVGDYPRHDKPSQVLQVGGGWRLTPTQQLDVHVGVGLTSVAPVYFVGVGYSIRFDGLF